MEKKNYIITINGPSSSGKSSAGLEVAKSLNFSFLSTGNVYRSYAWVLQNHNIVNFVQKKCLEIMEQYNFEFVGKDVYYNGKNIANEIGYEELALKTAMLARKKWYRKWLNTNVILPFIKNKSIVIEGRGLKEIVPNPDADFFIKSTIYARAFRRIRQFKKRFGISNVSLDTIYKQIQKRDYLDINRKIAPLRKEKNAKVINNTALKRINSVKRMLFIIHKRFPELTIDWKIPGSLK